MKDLFTGFNPVQSKNKRDYYTSATENKEQVVIKKLKNNFTDHPQNLFSELKANEDRFGITKYLTDVKGENRMFSGYLKQNHFDFIVHEVDASGKTVYLTSLSIPKELRHPDEVFDEENENSLSETERIAIGYSELAKFFDPKEIEKIKNFLEQAQQAAVPQDEKEQFIKEPSIPVSSSEQTFKGKTQIHPGGLSVEITPMSGKQINGDEMQQDTEEIDLSAAKEARKLIHGIFKKYFPLIDSQTTDKKTFKLVFYPSSKDRRRASQQRRNPWPTQQWGGEFLEFVLQKENKETTDAVNELCFACHVKPKLFAWSGTKDKRAITIQKLTAYRLQPEKLIAANTKLPAQAGVKVGNLRVVKEPLRLGSHIANRFSIVMRDISTTISGGGDFDGVSPFTETITCSGIVSTSTANGLNCSNNNNNEKISMSSSSNFLDDDELTQKKLTEIAMNTGFINYFGLQRFGRNDDVPTYKVGICLLKESFDEAIKNFFRTRYDERVSGIITDYYDGKLTAAEAYQKIPKFKKLERNIFHSYSKNGTSNHHAAFMTFPRNFKMLFLHAYQSYIWNLVASERIEKYGLKAVVGDLVVQNGKADDFVEDHVDIDNLEVIDEVIDNLEDLHKDNINEVDDPDEKDGESVNPLDDGQQQQLTTAENSKQKDSHIRKTSMKVLNESDVHLYSIHDVILPIVGSNSIFPENDFNREYFERILEKDGVSLANFKKVQKTFACYGSYRKLIAKPTDFKASLVYYESSTDKLQLSDEDILNGVQLKLEKVTQNPIMNSSVSMLVMEDDVQKNKNDEVKKEEFLQHPIIQEQHLNKQKKKALILEFTLGVSSYATMLLRELQHFPSQ